MSGQIRSNCDAAFEWSKRLGASYAFGSLHGVDDDNTLAESGIYNTAHEMKALVNKAFSALSADAAGIVSAAGVYKSADQASAGEFK